MKWLEQNISFFENFSAQPEIITIGDWLKSSQEISSYSKTVMEYRKTRNKYLKKSLPLITPGAVMESGRAKENIKVRTGWVAIDIDAKGNESIYDWPDLRNQIAKIDYIAYAGLSVSGNGVWGLIKVSNPEKQAEHFRQLLADFQHNGIQLDKSKGRNPNDARFYSYDTEAYIAPEFEVYDRLPVKNVYFKKKKSYKKKALRVKRSSGLQSTESNVILKLKLIHENSINIAPDYPSYLRVGFAMADEFGEAGRDYFHQAIQYSSKYDRAEADRQFTNCLKSGNSGTSIATFFHLCTQHNI